MSTEETTYILWAVGSDERVETSLRSNFRVFFHTFSEYNAFHQSNVGRINTFT